MGWDRTAYSLNTDSIYSGLMDLQGSLEAQSSYWTSPRRSPTLSPVPHHAYSPSSERASLRHKSPTYNAKPSGSAQAHRISPGPNKDFPHGSGMELEDFTISFTHRKRKNETSIEDFFNLAAPYSKFFNKMAKTIGHQN
ncbi:hypothetical protein CDL15_Pgr026313 [Punica granatum]|nr:hypothetical protein CDL15_Pgr026313 [Punica granatum]